ncbi:hypothetical protein SAY86_027407 [Trapa natans]|uniref:Uncharacterized protein n=1 Tax=Trapa natans TaxID=22666 RepID=A0AAN7KMB7_TRANT|nr:hypothetical protein SAY86_027407 [Trapa natans]
MQPTRRKSQIRGCQEWEEALKGREEADKLGINNDSEQKMRSYTENWREKTEDLQPEQNRKERSERKPSGKTCWAFNGV